MPPETPILFPPFRLDVPNQQLWQGAADMLTSYSDKKYVSDEYGRELSSARTQAVWSRR